MRRGAIRLANGKTHERYRCEAGHYFTDDPYGDSWPSVLFFDIETLPLVGYAWDVWKTDIQPVQLIKDWCVLSWSAKWYGDDRIMSDILKPKECEIRDDKRLMQSFWPLLDQADVVIAQNGRDFDVKKVNTRFLMHRMPPPSSYKLIDTLLALRSVFAMTYNKQDFVNAELGLQRKIKTDFELWKRCDRGERKALAEMRAYNETDILGLEALYVRLRPWVKNHPRLTAYDKVQGVCPYCFGAISDNGYYQAAQNRYKEYRCTSCGGVSHETRPVREEVSTRKKRAAR